MSNPAVAQYNWNADYGTNLVRPFIWKDFTGTAYNVTGYTATITVRLAYSTDPVLSVTQADYITVGTTDGKFSVNVPAETMEIGSPNSSADYVWDLVVTSPGGVVTKVVEGTFTLNPTSSWA